MTSRAEDAASRAPAEGTAERWAWDYVHATSLAAKLHPPACPDAFEEAAPERRIGRPGRPLELRTVDRATKTRGLRAASGRARAMHTFFHHELQAAELMAWAVLAFPGTPVAFRRGLLRIATDEVRHMNLYASHVEALGHRIGDFVVRDWFWERVPSTASPVSFVATMGLGFESANLDHARTFAARFRDAGDEAAARVQEVVGREEVAHARFGAEWFVRLGGPLTFAAWRDALPPPLSPMLMRGSPIQREARERAGFSPVFLDELEAWQPGS
jgi:uncharacterized ferritin-like protein (DUF455 family)